MASDRDIERVWTRGLMDYAAAKARDWPDDTCQALVFDVLEPFPMKRSSTLPRRSSCKAIFVRSKEMRWIEPIRCRCVRLFGLASRRHVTGAVISGRQATAWGKPIEGAHQRLFMRASYGFGEGQAYTKGLADFELVPFIPLLLEIAGEAPSCPTIAYMYLHILECLEPSTAEAPDGC